MAALMQKYADMIVVEQGFKGNDKYYFNILYRKIESIITDMEHFTNPEQRAKIQSEITKNDDITILENVQIGMMAMNDEERQKVEDYVYSILKDTNR